MKSRAPNGRITSLRGSEETVVLTTVSFAFRDGLSKPINHPSPMASSGRKSLDEKLDSAGKIPISAYQEWDGGTLLGRCADRVIASDRARDCGPARLSQPADPGFLEFRLVSRSEVTSTRETFCPNGQRGAVKAFTALRFASHSRCQSSNRGREARAAALINAEVSASILPSISAWRCRRWNALTVSSTGASGS